MVFFAERFSPPMKDIISQGLQILRRRLPASPVVAFVCPIVMSPSSAIRFPPPPPHTPMYPLQSWRPPPARGISSIFSPSPQTAAALAEAKRRDPAVANLGYSRQHACDDSGGVPFQIDEERPSVRSIPFLGSRPPRIRSDSASPLIRGGDSR